MGRYDLFFLTLDTLFDFRITKVPDMRTYQNEHMLLNFPRCLSILLLQTSKTDKCTRHWRYL
jgi:hypothetical protein